MERHFGLHIVQRLHQKVRRAHPELQGSECMLHGAAPHRHDIRIAVQPVLDRFQNRLVLPALNAALLAGGALFFQRAG